MFEMASLEKLLYSKSLSVHSSRNLYAKACFPVVSSLLLRHNVTHVLA